MIFSDMSNPGRKLMLLTHVHLNLSNVVVQLKGDLVHKYLFLYISSTHISTSIHSKSFQFLQANTFFGKTRADNILKGPKPILDRELLFPNKKHRFFIKIGTWGAEMCGSVPFFRFFVGWWGYPLGKNQHKVPYCSMGFTKTLIKWKKWWPF